MMQLSPIERKQVAEIIQELTAALSNLQLVYEKIETSLETSAVIEEELLEQNQRSLSEFYYYQNLFQLSLDAFLLTDTNGIILEANQVIATLLNVSRPYLIGKSLANFVIQSDRQALRTFLGQLSFVSDEKQNLEIGLCSRQGEPFAAVLKAATVRDRFGEIEALRIGVHDMREYKVAIVNAPDRQIKLADTQAEVTTALTLLPQSLDGLQVLVIDDEADIREFIRTILETQGIRVTAVASAAAALEELGKFHPDVLISDIRMPGGDGYSLIRQIRALEVEQGGHIPAAAITAYLEEERAKSISAGFEWHLHKLAQPTEWIEMVAQLAGRASGSKT